MRFTRGPFAALLVARCCSWLSAACDSVLLVAQLGLDEGCDDADDGGVVVPCDVLFPEVGCPGWLDAPVEPVSVGWPDRPVLLGPAADDDP
jgi:hypothetical protein